MIRVALAVPLCLVLGLGTGAAPVRTEADRLAERVAAVLGEAKIYDLKLTQVAEHFRSLASLRQDGATPEQWIAQSTADQVEGVWVRFEPNATVPGGYSLLSAAVRLPALDGAGNSVHEAVCRALTRRLGRRPTSNRTNPWGRYAAWWRGPERPEGRRRITVEQDAQDKQRRPLPQGEQHIMVQAYIDFTDSEP